MKSIDLFIDVCFASAQIKILNLNIENILLGISQFCDFSRNIKLICIIQNNPIYVFVNLVKLSSMSVHAQNINIKATNCQIN